MRARAFSAGDSVTVQRDHQGHGHGLGRLAGLPMLEGADRLRHLLRHRLNREFVMRSPNLGPAEI